MGRLEYVVFVVLCVLYVAHGQSNGLVETLTESSFPFILPTAQALVLFENKEPSITFYGDGQQAANRNNNNTFVFYFVSLIFTQTDSDTTNRSYLPYTLDLANRTWASTHENNTEFQRLNFTLTVQGFFFRLSFVTYAADQALCVIPPINESCYTLASRNLKYNMDWTIDEDSPFYIPDYGVEIALNFSGHASLPGSIVSPKDPPYRLRLSWITDGFDPNGTKPGLNVTMTLPKYADPEAPDLFNYRKVQYQAYLGGAIGNYNITRRSLKYDPDFTVLFSSGSSSDSNPGANGGGGGGDGGVVSENGKETGGLSTSAKAGIAVGVIGGTLIIFIVVVVVVVLAFFHYQKTQMDTRLATATNLAN